jgi:preprotein translocase subunit SecA
MNYNVIINDKDIYSDHLTFDGLVEDLQNKVLNAYEQREQELSSEQMREIERRVLLSVVDELWRDHLREMDLMKEGIGFRAYAQKDPLIEYKKESFHLFQKLVSNINRNVAKKVFTTYIVAPENLQDFLRMAKQRHEASSAFDRPTPNPAPVQTNQPETAKLQPRVVENKVGRNDPCPCGSGKKYKKCCGKLA